MKDKQPRFLFLMETKIRKYHMEVVRNQIGFEGLPNIDLVGRSGGLALLWKEANEVEIQNFSRCHINAIITMGGSSAPWKFTGFYGHLNRVYWDES